MAKNQLATRTLNSNSLLTATIFDEGKTKSKKSITQNKNKTSLTGTQGNPGVKYEKYLQSLGAIQKSDTSGTTVKIQTKSGELVEVVPISFQEYITIVQSQGSLPTKKDYLNKQHEVKSENSQVVQTEEPTAISLNHTNSTTMALNQSDTPTSFQNTTHSTDPTPESVTSSHNTVIKEDSSDDSSDDSSENLGDFLEGSHLLKSLISWDLKRSNLEKSSILELSKLELSKLELSKLELSKLELSKLEVSNLSEAKQEEIAKELIIRSLKVINNPELKKRVLANLKDSQNLDLSAVSDFTQSSVEEEKALISAEEALYFKQFISVFSTLHEERSAVANIVPKSNDDLTNLILNKDEIEKSSEKTLLDDPEFTTSVFKNLFPKANITASWHVLFPNCSIKEVWAQNDQKLMLKEFWNKCFEGHAMPSAAEAQQYKDLEMLQSARKSVGVNNPVPLKLSTCDNELGMSQLPDTQSDEFKKLFKLAINQAGNPELASKILQYNYPTEDPSNGTEAESNQEEEVILSQEQVQFFQSFVCAMILQDNSASFAKKTQQEGGNGNCTDMDKVITNSCLLVNSHPRDVAQWFEMCFPKAHLPKSWGAIFPHISIQELSKKHDIKVVFSNYELSEDNLPPVQKENLNLFLEYGPGDKFDIGKENLTADFDNLCNEQGPNQPLVKKTSEYTSKDNTDPTIQSQFTENPNLTLYYNAYTTGATNTSQSLIQDISIEQSTSIEASGSSTDGVENKNIISYYLTLSSNPAPTTGQPIAPQTFSGSEIIPQKTKEEKEEAQDEYITVSQGGQNGQDALATSNHSVTNTTGWTPMDDVDNEELTREEIEKLQSNWSSLSNVNANNLESESQKEMVKQYEEYIKCLGTFNNEGLGKGTPTIVITFGTVSFHAHFPTIHEYRQGHHPTKDKFIQEYNKQLLRSSLPPLVISIPMESSDQAQKLDNHLHPTVVLQDPQTPKVETPQQPPSASKGFFSGVFGFFTAPIFSAWSGLNSLLGLKKAAPTPEGTIIPNQTGNSNDLTKTILNGDNTTHTSTQNTSEAPAPESKSFGSFFSSLFPSISSCKNILKTTLGMNYREYTDSKNSQTPYNKNSPTHSTTSINPVWHKWPLYNSDTTDTSATDEQQITGANPVEKQ